MKTTNEILDIFRERKGDPQGDEMYICFPCDPLDENVFLLLIEESKSPYKELARYTVHVGGERIAFRNNKGLEIILV